VNYPARTPALLAAAAGLALLTGCPDQEVTHARVAKEPTAVAAPAARPMAAPAMPPSAAPAPVEQPMATPPPGMKGDVPMPPKPTGAEAVTWTLPQGWTQTLTGGIRYATLIPSEGTGIDASVVVLPGPAGGEVANVNRWRGQIGLAPLEQAGIDALRKSVDTQVGPVSVFDFSSEGTSKTRLVAAQVVVNGSNWFFKMTGGAEAVGKALPGFNQLIASLRPGPHAN
jgi:hypothetical protein